MSGSSIPPSLIPYLTGQKKDYSTVAPQIVYINAIFLGLVLVTAGARFWVRFGKLSSAGLDDILMILAIVFSICLSVACFVGEEFGLGKHIWNLSPNLANIPTLTANVTKSLYGAYLAYATAITFTKLSIAATYYRIFPPGNLRKSVITVAVLVIAFWISSIFAIIFTCVPVKAAWTYTIVDAKCYPVVNFFYASAGFHIITDIFLCALPIKTLWALKMAKAQRVILCVLFCGGTFACLASVFRLTHLKKLHGFDVTFDTGSSLVWSVIEVDTGIICASISALRPLFRYLPVGFWPRYFGSGLRSTAYPGREKYISSNARSGISHVSSNGTKSMGAYTSTIEEHEMKRNIGLAPSKSEIYVQHTYEVDSDQLPNVAPKVALPSRITRYSRYSFESSQDLVSPAHGAMIHERSLSVLSAQSAESPEIGFGATDPIQLKRTLSDGTTRAPLPKSIENPTSTKPSSKRKSAGGMFTSDLFETSSLETASSEEDLVHAKDKKGLRREMEPIQAKISTGNHKVDWRHRDDGEDTRRSFDETDVEDSVSIRRA